MADFNITGVKKPLKPMVFELEIDESPPPLVLLINPDTLDIKFTPRVSEIRTRWTSRSESPYLLHAHHDDLDVITASGVSAMFYTNRGISNEQKRTVGWENTQKLLAIYKNNGMNFNKKPSRRGSGVIVSVGRVLLIYDGYLHRGSFEDFTLSETADRPFNINFDFNFKVTETFNVGSISQTILNNILQSDPRFARQ